MRQTNMRDLQRADSGAQDSARLAKVPLSYHSGQQTRVKTRTSNACEACKRRKTKCTGFPSPCSVCIKANTYCCFNPRLDTRRRSTSSSSNSQERQQFMVTALLQSLKHTPAEDLTNLLKLIRESSQPDDLAECLQEHFTTLQTKGLLPKFTFDRSDITSFAQEGLCGYRKDCPRLSPSATEDVPDLSSSNSEKSSAIEADISQHNIFGNEFGIQDDDLVKEQSLNIDETDIPPDGLNCAEMFHLAVRLPPKHDDLDLLHQGYDKSFHTPSKLNHLRVSRGWNSGIVDVSIAPYDEHLGPNLDFPMVTPYFINPVIFNHPTQRYLCNPSYPGQDAH